VPGRAESSEADSSLGVKPCLVFPPLGSQTGGYGAKLSGKSVLTFTGEMEAAPEMVSRIWVVASSDSRHVSRPGYMDAFDRPITAVGSRTSRME
jgi:hypothetical protein